MIGLVEGAAALHQDQHAKYAVSQLSWYIISKQGIEIKLRYGSEEAKVYREVYRPEREYGLYSYAKFQDADVDVNLNKTLFIGPPLLAVLSSLNYFFASIETTPTGIVIKDKTPRLLSLFGGFSGYLPGRYLSLHLDFLVDQGVVTDGNLHRQMTTEAYRSMCRLISNHVYQNPGADWISAQDLTIIRRFNSQPDSDNQISIEEIHPTVYQYLQLMKQNNSLPENVSQTQSIYLVSSVIGFLIFVFCVIEIFFDEIITNQPNPLKLKKKYPGFFE